MQNIPENVRHEIVKLVPSSIINEIACFVFYDNHPVQRKHCDITVCTKHGEVKEYYKREEVSSLFLRSTFKASQISILRNSKCQLFYLLVSDQEVVILSRKDKLKVHQRVTNVDYYDVEDSVCRGQACLKIVQKDDAVPLIFDDKFENLREKAVVLSSIHVDDSLPILTQLKRKLTQAKYSIKCNEKTHKEFIDLRKLTAFAAYQKIHPNLDDSLFNQSYKEGCEALKLKSQTPCVKICNHKVVIVLNVLNKSKELLTDVTVLLHASYKPSIVYTTKLFQHTNCSPFWKPATQELAFGVETAIAVVVDLAELQYSVTSRVEFSGVISYKKMDTEYLVPFDYVVISHFEAMGKQFDVLANEIDDISVLSVLATTEKFDMSLRIIGNEDELAMPLPDMFCQYLEMERINKIDNAVIHKYSPYHTLNGALIVFEENVIADNSFPVAVHVRSHHQILPLIHYIHEAIPQRIIVTSRNHRITTSIDSLRIYNEKIPNSAPLKLNYIGYAASILRQIAMILEHFDSCIVKMNANKDAVVQSKIGKEIDLCAGGMALYKEFRTNLLKEALRGVLCLKQMKVTSGVSFESMFLNTE